MPGHGLFLINLIANGSIKPFDEPRKLNNDAIPPKLSRLNRKCRDK